MLWTKYLRTILKFYINVKVTILQITFQIYNYEFFQIEFEPHFQMRVLHLALQFLSTWHTFCVMFYSKFIQQCLLFFLSPSSLVVFRFLEFTSTSYMYFVRGFITYIVTGRDFDCSVTVSTVIAVIILIFNSRQFCYKTKYFSINIQYSLQAILHAIQIQLLSTIHGPPVSQSVFINLFVTQRAGQISFCENNSPIYTHKFAVKCSD